MSFFIEKIKILKKISKKILIVWHCVIFIRSGLYKDGKFKFVMEFLKDFPKSKPCVRFQQSIFHPLINPDNNILDMNVKNFFFEKKLKKLKKLSTFFLLGNTAAI